MDTTTYAIYIYIFIPIFFVNEIVTTAKIKMAQFHGYQAPSILQKHKVVDSRDELMNRNPISDDLKYKQTIEQRKSLAEKYSVSACIGKPTSRTSSGKPKDLQRQPSSKPMIKLDSSQKPPTVLKSSKFEENAVFQKQQLDETIGSPKLQAQSIYSGYQAPAILQKHKVTDPRDELMNRNPRSEDVIFKEKQQQKLELTQKYNAKISGSSIMSSSQTGNQSLINSKGIHDNYKAPAILERHKIIDPRDQLMDRNPISEDEKYKQSLQQRQQLINDHNAKIGSGVQIGVQQSQPSNQAQQSRYQHDGYKAPNILQKHQVSDARQQLVERNPLSEDLSYQQTEIQRQELIKKHNSNIRQSGHMDYIVDNNKSTKQQDTQYQNQFAGYRAPEILNKHQITNTRDQLMDRNPISVDEQYKQKYEERLQLEKKYRNLIGSQSQSDEVQQMYETTKQQASVQSNMIQQNTYDPPAILKTHQTQDAREKLLDRNPVDPDTQFKQKLEQSKQLEQEYQGEPRGQGLSQSVLKDQQEADLIRQQDTLNYESHEDQMKKLYQQQYEDEFEETQSPYNFNVDHPIQENESQNEEHQQQPIQQNEFTSDFINQYPVQNQDFQTNQIDCNEEDSDEEEEQESSDDDKKSVNKDDFDSTKDTNSFIQSSGFKTDQNLDSLNIDVAIDDTQQIRLRIRQLRDEQISYDPESFEYQGIQTQIAELINQLTF